MNKVYFKSFFLFKLSILQTVYVWPIIFLGGLNFKSDPLCRWFINNEAKGVKITPYVGDTFYQVCTDDNAEKLWKEATREAQQATEAASAAVSNAAAAANASSAAAAAEGRI